MPKKVINKVLDTVEETVDEVEREVNTVFRPVRESVLKRFPILFILLVTFGVAATFFGFERLLMEIDFIYTRPLLMLSIGILVLVGTGTLYKKLG